jgi:predicted 3-demethylubiquinone-9 3-methyltransferase (glyoxalase superfamily)
MQNISTCLWFNSNAEEAVSFYTSIFKNSAIGTIARYGEAGASMSGQPKGSVMTIKFKIEGQELLALNGGPTFSFTPAISLFVSCDSEEEINALYEQLSVGGSVLMPFAQYPFSKKYCWINDKFGVSWQLNLASHSQKIRLCLMFVGEQNGKAEEAMNFYVSNFKNSKVTGIASFAPGEGGTEGTVKHGNFSLNGQDFVALDGGLAHQFAFTPATSIIVNCETQEQVDDMWEKLPQDGGGTVNCGWLYDRFGISWQIVPTFLTEIMQDKDSGKTDRVMEALGKMCKLEIEGLKQAYSR